MVEPAARSDYIDEMKKSLFDTLKNHGVMKASLFGSIVRGKTAERNDINIVIEFEGRKNLLDLVGLRLDIQELLKRKVDVVIYKSLHPLLKERILSEQEVIL